MNRGVVQISLTSDHSYCESTVWPHKGSHFLHSVISFRSWTSSRAGFIFNGFTDLWKCLMPLEHVISTMHAPHRPVSFYWKFQCRFPQSLTQNLIAHRCSKLPSCISVTHTHTYTHTHTHTHTNCFT
jgi:hypothetical protein